ncbi:cbb3-type cytochrome c oxidase subunit II [Opitutus sp. ER46]|uniref:cbb3-type cytochrome c oxidase subunit II n=1 Tax=Opitutus sp. ER46 TaxID=2161864 RepID=UPI000D31B0AD|nr:cbb3-type cytochrome c oxidase subunit II [Opitutus sp. ER46]PTX92670.1 hypothetical protein DB354_15215 [Opitutus sp. ER46]
MTPTAPTPQHPVRSWFAALGAITATYVYFLIFAEFAFLELARASVPAADQLRLILAALCLGGISGAVLAASRRWAAARGNSSLAWGLRAGAASALLALAVSSWAGLIIAAAAVGLSLGFVTVALASALRAAAGERRLGLCIGAGTGLAYATCNLPILFQASPTTQSLVAALVALLASALPRWMQAPEPPSLPAERSRSGGVIRWIVVLLALVWMDSAAFYVIQHTPALRAATWGTSNLLWANAGVHFAAAVVGGILLDRGVRIGVAASAMALLGVACLILDGVLPGASFAGWWYTGGVSLYSTLLVDFPARTGRRGVAAAVFAVAGWTGSALGVGMAQDLDRVPTAFVVVAAAAVAAALWRARQVRFGASLAAMAVVVLLSAGCARESASADPVVRGREVYISEGCIHCHSQYIRPRVRTEVGNWGPGVPFPESLEAAPPLFGTRRQGPDLSQVGNRRSPEWNRLHLISPGSVSAGSRMPSYAGLFADGDSRGADLIAYLASLGRDTGEARAAQIAAWAPATADALAPAEARRLFLRLCTACHGPEGHGDGPLAGRLSLRPPDWPAAPWRHVVAGADPELQVARIIKFGLPGLPMAGHEYLSDREVLGLARYVQTLHPPPARR